MINETKRIPRGIIKANNRKLTKQGCRVEELLDRVYRSEKLVEKMRKEGKMFIGAATVY